MQITTHDGNDIIRNGDLWTIPALIGDDRGRRPGTLCVRIVDGQACHAMTSGPAAAQEDHHRYTITTSGPIKGWGTLDDERAYVVGAATVPATLLERVAEMSGLVLPARCPDCGGDTDAPGAVCKTCYDAYARASDEHTESKYGCADPADWDES